MSGTANTTVLKTKTNRRKLINRKKSKKSVKAVAQPSRCRTALHQGIYISPPRIKHCLDSNGINRSIEDAINELRDAEPHEVPVVDTKTGKPTGKTQTTTLVPFDRLSESTRALVKKARTTNDEREKENLKREKVKADKLAEDIKAGRVDATKLDEERKAAETAAKLQQEERVVKDAARKALGHPVRGPKKVTKYSAEVELLSKMRIRFAKEGPTQVAASICAAVHELMEFGMANALKQGRKILKRRHVLQAGYESLPLACLYRNLDVFKWALSDESARVAEEAKKKEEKKLKKKDDAAPDAALDAPPQVEEDDEEDDEEDERNFGHYVKQVCHNIMNQKLENFKPQDKKDKHPYEDIRVSLEIREFGSDLIIDFIRRLCPLLKGQINSMNVKTISQGVIKQTINFMLEYAGVDHEQVNKLLDAKFEEYRVWMEKKKVDKAAAAVVKEAKKAADAAAAAAAIAAGLPLPVKESEDEEPEDEDEEPEDEDHDEDETKA